MDAALIVAADCEELFAGLIASPRTYDITSGIERGTTRIVRARRRALLRAHLFFWSATTAVWLAVASIALSWEYGILVTLAAASLTWWAQRSFNPYGRVVEAESDRRQQ